MCKFPPLILLLALSLAACLTGPTVNLRIEGTVTDAATGAPIEGAHLQLYLLYNIRLAEAKTDSQGRYTLLYRNEDCQGDERLSVYALGHRDGSSPSYKNTRCTSKTQTIDFRLTPH